MLSDVIEPTNAREAMLAIDIKMKLIKYNFDVREHKMAVAKPIIILLPIWL